MGMSSINTNYAAVTALQNLQITSKEMLSTQNRISTGLRVATAEDNAAYWSIATTMRSDNKALSTVQDALGLGKATINVAYTAMNSSIDVTSEIKAKLVAAREPGSRASPTRRRSLVRTGSRSTLRLPATTRRRRSFLRSRVRLTAACRSARSASIPRSQSSTTHRRLPTASSTRHATRRAQWLRPVPHCRPWTSAR